MLKHLFGIRNLILVGNSSKKANTLDKRLNKKVIQKDVHLLIINGKERTILSAGDAVAKVVSMHDGFGFIWTIHKILPYPARIIYFISKKIRKHIIN
jgi:hypothetical protein